MVSPLEIAQLVRSGEGARLLATVKRLVQTQGLSVTEIMRQSVEHMERMEELAAKSGKTVKQVANECLDLYEAQL